MCQGPYSCNTQNNKCCPFKVNAGPDCQDGKLSVGPCSSEGKCQGPYACNTLNNKCCPVKLNSGDCQDGSQSVGPCDSEGMCQGPYLCNTQSNKCCPIKLNSGDCPDNTLSTGPCDSEGNCDGPYSCNIQNNKCCPIVLNTGDCQDGSQSRGLCDSEGKCQGSYACNIQNNKCCPIRVNSGDCPDNAPSIGSCDTEGKCQGPYSCNTQSNKCCPLKLNTGDCPDNAQSIGSCDTEGKCQGPYSCNTQSNKCCPIKLNTGECQDNALYIGSCDSEGKCQGPYSCNTQNNKCCPIKVNSGDCDDNAQSIGSCDREGQCQGPYSCNTKNNKCCPIKVNSGDCEDNAPSMGSCDSEGMCQGPYSCNRRSNKCCPIKVNVGDCQDGMPSKGPCDTEGKCQGPYSCNTQSNKCCPIKLNTGECSDGMPSVGPCDNEGMCQGPYTCNSLSNKCCPVRVNSGFCPIMKSGQVGVCVEECSSDKQCQGILRCCSNGCGHTCQMPVYPENMPGQCPLYIPNSVGVCIGSDNAKQKCTVSTDCSNEEICCNSGCGLVCTLPSNMTPCQREFHAAKQQMRSKLDTCTPIFIPRCDANGAYRRMQCYDNNGLCFCVHTNGTKIPGTEVRGNPDCSKATKPGLCPSINSFPPSDLICTSSCQSDDECTGHDKCCSNGCAYHCMSPRVTPAFRRKRDTTADTCDDGMPSNGPCDGEGNCGGVYFCNRAKNICCPIRLDIIHTCADGAVSQTSCDSEGLCPAGFSCENNHCCPNVKNNGDTSAFCVYRPYIDTTVTYVGTVASGKMPSAEACKAACDKDTLANCIGVVYQKDNGGRCSKYSDQTHVTKVPFKGSIFFERLCQVSAGLCRNQSIALLVAGDPKTCVNDADCGVQNFGCEDGHCCPKMYAPTPPTPIEKCSNGGLVVKDAMGRIKTCDETNLCGRGEECENAVCCPKAISKDICPNNGVVLMEDGSPKSCMTTAECGSLQYSCQGLLGSKYCCPTQSVIDVCPNGGIPMKSDGIPKKCSTTTDCGPSYSCQESAGNSYCCPYKLNVLDICPNNGLVMISDGQPRRCVLNADCLGAGGLYSCVQNYCCPQNVNQNSCPHNGKALIVDGQPRLCTADVECQGSGQGSFSCQHGYCCPQSINVCPWNGMALVVNGQTRTCTVHSDCKEGGYSCYNGHCCPHKINTVCTDGSAPQCCDINLCVRNTCPSNARAVCRLNPCGGCQVEFYDQNNNVVNCSSGLTECQIQRQKAVQVSQFWIDTTFVMSDAYVSMVNSESKFSPTSTVPVDLLSSKPGQCPGGNIDDLTTSKNLCSKDTDCTGTNKCCFDGRNSICKPPVIVPIYKHYCEKPPVMGDCEGYFERYFFNSTSQKCEKFIYGGCHGNENNFLTMLACQRGCMEGMPTLCLQKPDPGICKAYIPMYFYNVTTNQCEKFVYGGCQGNRNKFSTLQQCYSTCSTIQVPSEPCKRVRCPANTVCVTKNSQDAECVSDGKLPDPIGVYFPDCLDDGMFAPVQCQGSLCWCVNSQGVRIPGSLKVGRPSCQGSSTDPSTSPTPTNVKTPACADGSTPRVCDTCMTAKCEGNIHVKCVADPCNNCRVRFVDKTDKEVQCGGRCNIVKPTSMNQISDQKCGNRIQVWYYNRVTKTCEESFQCSYENQISNTFMSKLECQSHCTGSICGGTGPLTCVTRCSDQTCNRFPSAVCRINPCTCNAEFFDPVTNKEVNCNEVIPICQIKRANEKQSSAGDTFKLQSEVTTQYVCTDQGEFQPQQCDSSKKCWCVDGLGQMTSQRRLSVNDVTENIGCKDNKTLSATVSVKYNVNYNQVILGKEKAFKQAFMKRLDDISPELSLYVTSLQLRRGSVIVDIKLLTPDSPSSNSKEIGAFVNLLSSEISKGLKLTFEGQNLVSESQVSSRLTFQHEPEEHTKAPVTNGNNNTTVIIIIIVVVLLAVLILLAGVIYIARRKGTKFSTLEDGSNSPRDSSTMLFRNSACDKK